MGDFGDETKRVVGDVVSTGDRLGGRRSEAQYAGS
jgi:hypothetical protein